MRSLSRILKPAQTVTGSMKVHVYQTETEAGSPDDSKAGEGETRTGEAWAGEMWTGEAWNGEQDLAGRRYALITEEKRKILERARDQAEQSAARILEDAYAQRDNIVNTARDEAGRIGEQARQEGYSRGLEESLQDIERDIGRIRMSLDGMEEEFAEYRQQIEHRIAGLAFMMAEKILKKKVEQDETELTDMIEAAVLSERDKTSITVHIPAQTAGLVEQLEERLRPLKERMGGTLRIRTEERAAGFVQVETEEGIVDASLDVQLANLKKQLMALEGPKQA